ncbi:MAG: cobalt-precorrin 5A hydrolase [Clostridia bacterium]|nr:cobalt-precorrin 5A hydrolase [Clostridia bacterium]
MSISIFSVTKGGYQLSKQLKAFYPSAELYVSAKVGQAPDHLMDGTLKDCVQVAFKRDSAIIFVMATGIVVRSIAPYLQHKTEDPAVLVIDEKGDYIISLLSGHIGGGNALALDVAQKLGGQAVVTTSSDVQHKIAVDVLAVKNGFVIDSIHQAKVMASAIVNGEPLVLATDGKVQIDLDAQWRQLDMTEFQKALSGMESAVLLISNRVCNIPPTLQLIPKNLVLGVGCRRDTPKEHLMAAVEKALKECGRDRRSIRMIATVDVKADEKGLVETAEALDVPLEIIERTRIKVIENQFVGSDFVEKTIGVRAVCEPAAQLGSGKSGRFIMEKTPFDGITIAIWEEEYEIR